MAIQLDEPLSLESGRSFSRPQASLSRLSILDHPLPLSNSEPQPIPTATAILDAPVPLVRKDLHILDFDIETRPEGFDDQQWMPQKITCVAWSWVGDDLIESRIATPDGLFYKPELRRDMLAELLVKIRAADMVTGHYIEQFDLPRINAECGLLGLEPIRKLWVQDTKRLFRSKGLKQGQDNLCELFETEEKKYAMNWQQWQKAYAEPGWPTIRHRCESDVRANKQLRVKLLNAGYMLTPRKWIGWK